jgi:hypothetical protein
MVQMDSYGGVGTRDFFSQMYPFSLAIHYDIFSMAGDSFLGSSGMDRRHST